MVWQGSYKPFGEVTETTATVEQNIRFPGQYFEEETGLHYNYFRDYDPGAGRYVESDPIGLSGGINTYTYASNDSLQNSDERGLTDTGAAIGGGIGCSVGSAIGAFFGGAGGGVMGLSCGPGPGAVACTPVAASAGMVAGASTGCAYGGAIGAVVGNAVSNLCRVSEREACEEDCDEAYDRDKFVCDAGVATQYGFNSTEYVACLARVRKIHIECMQDCK